jgi:signal peptidase I
MTNRGRRAVSGAGFTVLMASVLEKGVPFRFTAPGHSMTPFIRDGDVITVAPVRIRFGDVVAFVSPHGGKLTVHRVVRVSRDGYLIKGDNTVEPDGTVPRTSLLGRVVGVEHCSRHVRLGLGIERVAIAYLSRRGWLIPVIGATWRVMRPVANRWFA